MKKVFPLIIVLITLSVLGIIFIQMSWIDNAISLRKKQHEQDLNHAISQIKESLNKSYLYKTGRIGWYNEEQTQYYLQTFTTQTFSTDEITEIIDKQLM